MSSVIRKLIIGFNNAYLMQRVHSLMVAEKYESALVELDKLKGPYIQTEALLIKCYALGKLGRGDEIEDIASLALKYLGDGNYSSVGRMYINAFAESVCPSVVKSEYFEGYEPRYLRENIQSVSPTLRRTLPLVWP